MFANASRRLSDEFLDAPTGSVFDPVGYGQSGEHDHQVGAELTCSIWRDPFREDHTICTAVARPSSPCAHTPPPHPTGRRLVHPSQPANTENRISSTYHHANRGKVAQVRFYDPWQGHLSAARAASRGA